MSTKRLYNFNPGPATLPLDVIQEFGRSFNEFGGMSIFEISHRSKGFIAILEESGALVRELLGVPDNYHILFLQGGASLQFAMVPLNLMDKTADYSLTGSWAKKAYSEALVYGEPNAVFSSEASKFSRVPQPDEIKLTPNTSYLHITTNNTIYGSQYSQFPSTANIPLVADMSSDILSRRINVSNFGLIYAGAQKNIGPAGVTLVIIRDDLARRTFRKVPKILSYASHVEEKSLYNTPCVAGIYLVNLTLKWMRRMGGIDAIEKTNKEKAKMIYDVIDSSKYYRSHIEKESRSLMNVCFTLESEEDTEQFLAGANEKGMVGLKGHRSVGGIRASIYNAFPIEGVKLFADYMRKFERVH